MSSVGFMKAIAVWSLIPSYVLAGGLVGYALDRWTHLFPLLTGGGMLIGFGFAVRDLLRLRDEVFGKKP